MTAGSFTVIGRNRDGVAISKHVISAANALDARDLAERIDEFTRVYPDEYVVDAHKGTIRLFVAEGWWQADFSEASDAEVIRLIMNETVLPTPFGARVPASQVLAVMERLNPENVVILAPTVVVPPVGSRPS